MGAKFGSSSYLWIVLGSIFAGAVHDYFAGMLSLRHEGESLPEIIGRYLGLTTKQIMRGFTVILMILVGSVFCGRSCGIAGEADAGKSGCYVLDYRCVCVLYFGYIVACR